MQRAPVAVHTDGTVSCATVLWRVLGGLQLTVVVKALFAIVPEGVATPLGPGEIVARDRTSGRSAESSVEAASDLAPFLMHCDVLFTGHAYALGGAVPASAARLRLSRYGRWVLDKTIHVYGDRGPGGAPTPFARMPIVYERAVGGPGSANPAGTRAPNLADPLDARRPTGFGPVSRLWPARRMLLGSIDPRSIEATVPEIPEAIPVEYYQAAPRDQQVELLRGGEWLVLDGLDPERRRVETWLPQARGVARLVVCRPGAPDTEIPVELGCDTLAIDGDRRTLALTWRGRCALPEGEALLPSLMVLAALERAEGSVSWGEIRPTVVAEAVPPARPPAPPPAPPRPRQSTVVIAPETGAARPRKAALPFGPAGGDEEQTAPALQIPQRPASIPRQRTVTLPPAELSARSQAALPFAPSGAPANPPSTDATPWSTPPAHPALVSPPAEASAPATSFGLGMRLSSAPLSMPPRPPDEPPWPLPPAELPVEEDDEIDTVQAHEPVAIDEPPRPPARVVIPPPRTMVPAPPSERPSRMPAPLSEPAPPIVTRSPSERPPPVKPAPLADTPAPAPERTVRLRSLPPPPDPWAEPFVPSSKPAPPPPQPTTFERPAAAAVKGSFYSKFVRK